MENKLNEIPNDLKTLFITREGTYRLMALSEYSRPNRVNYQSNQNSPQVRLSFVNLPNSNQNSQQQQSAATTERGSTTTTTSAAAAVATTNSNNNNNNNNNNTTSNGINGNDRSSNSLSSSATTATVTSLTNGLQQQDHNFLNQSLLNGYGNGGDRICFNFGKELFVYAYRGVKKVEQADLSKPIDKKLYKGTNPSCHDFNQHTATYDGASLLVGFTTGQIQMVVPGRREQGKLYNEERLIDKTKVTCLKWLPGSANLFLAAHASGHMYLYNEELPCSPTAPVYQPFKSGDGYTILTCKSKSTRNPLYKWQFGINCGTGLNSSSTSSSSSSSSSSAASTISSSSSSYTCSSDNCSINEFSFSPCGTNLAIVSQDGFLRVFHYDTMELVGIARSYFGGFLCVCWSPDGKYIVVGGEDDLVTVYSLNERRVVARGHGHRSWVSVVAFDPYTTFSTWDSGDFSDDENPCYEISTQHNKRVRASSIRDSNSLPPDKLAICYRLGSVSQDTQLCLWDITEDILRPHHRVRLSTLDPQQTQPPQKETVLVNGDASGGGLSSDVKSHTIPAKDNTIEISLNTTTTTTNTTTTSSTITSNNKVTKLTNHVDAEGNSSSSSSSNSNKFGSKGKSSSSIVPANVSNTSTLKASTQENQNHTNSLNNNNHNTNHHSTNNHSAFNSLTQRFTNFSFGSDKSSSSSKSNKRNFSLTNNKSSGSAGGAGGSQNATASADANSSTSTLRNKSNGSIVTSYDAMKLIGTPACPRYDECPVLEPLICKKIAHERLTALIFREDCFLTACQDGFVYTWARPNTSQIPSSPIAAQSNSSTIV